MPYPLSLRRPEDMMAERGIAVERSTARLWAIELLPLLEKAFRHHKRPVEKRWKMDDAYIRLKAEWTYLLRRRQEWR